MKCLATPAKQGFESVWYWFCSHTRQVVPTGFSSIVMGVTSHLPILRNILDHSWPYTNAPFPLTCRDSLEP